MLLLSRVTALSVSSSPMQVTAWEEELFSGEELTALQNNSIRDFWYEVFDVLCHCDWIISLLSQVHHEPEMTAQLRSPPAWAAAVLKQRARALLTNYSNLLPECETCLLWALRKLMSLLPSGKAKERQEENGKHTAELVNLPLAVGSVLSLAEDREYSVSAKDSASVQGRPCHQCWAKSASHYIGSSGTWGRKVETTSYQVLAEVGDHDSQDSPCRAD